MVKRALFLLVTLFFFSCENVSQYSNLFYQIEDAQLFQARELVPPETDANQGISVMSWNLKFAGARVDFFFDCYGDRVNMKEAEVTTHIKGLTEKINQQNPDILLAQEVDLKSDRTAKVNMIQQILDQTSFNYAAYASQWRVDYLPTDGIGRVDSGSVIFSKWPIVEALRLALPLRSDQPDWYLQFYLKRNILRAKINVPAILNASSGTYEERGVNILNVHTEAYNADDTKKKHLTEFENLMDLIDSEGEVFIAGGDFNALPPGSGQVKDFQDSICTGEFEADNFELEGDWLSSFYEKYTPAIALSDYQSNNAAHFTHSTSKDIFWNRKLDYLFTNRFFEGGKTHQEGTMPLSDHAPISTIFKFGEH